MSIQPAAINRDKYGHWTHPDWPDLGETLGGNYKLWARQNYIALDVVSMFDTVDLDSVDEWLSGNQSSFAEWVPKKPSQDSFLLSIHDTEDGPCAIFAIPVKE